MFFCWSVVVLRFWGALCLDPRRRWPGRLPLPETPSSAEEDGPGSDLAVVIPARNEEETLGETLPALLEQSADYARLVLVNDRSDDGTGELARKLLAESAASETSEVLEGGDPRRDGQERSTRSPQRSRRSSRRLEAARSAGFSSPMPTFATPRIRSGRFGGSQLSSRRASSRSWSG